MITLWDVRYAVKRRIEYLEPGENPWFTNQQRVQVNGRSRRAVKRRVIEMLRGRERATGRKEVSWIRFLGFRLVPMKRAALVEVRWTMWKDS